MYDIPDRVFEQWNHAEVSTSMGLFAELNHAWVSIDNSLYLWDYTNPNPEVIGFEEQNNGITAVKLVVPRAGVFVKSITHLLVVATTQEIILLGVEAAMSPSGVRAVSLYQTGMHLALRGIGVQTIEGSAATGRIFFAGEADNEVYELTYQQEEKWFASRCGRVNHTSPGYTALVPKSLWGATVKEHVVDMIVDDSRKLIYTLSSESSIRVFHMDSSTTLQQVIEKKRQECLRDISHMISQSPLLGQNMKIVSISPISAKEGSKLHLMATTTTGCRLYLSATRGYGYLNNQGAPQSMQVQHIKFPPRLGLKPTPYTGSSEQPIETASQSLSFTRMGLRFPPGFFMCFVTKQGRETTDALFLSAPDTGRIAFAQRNLSGEGSKYYEQGYWIEMNSIAEAVGLVTKPFAAAQQPVGFGNELAVQFDESPAEIAILTNNGIHIIRRRRLVDIFATAVRTGAGEEGFENEIKKFIRQYGRGETTATALAVACGQGSDTAPAPGDARAVRVSDPETLELARKCFVEFGGRPSINDNMASEGPLHAVENVRPSARHDGLALYMGRLVRSLWKANVITQKAGEDAKVSVTSTISPTKLITVQEDLKKLADFLEKNKSFIEGLAGPESLQRAGSQQEEVALQGEHQALYSLQRLNSSIIEGISFVQMLFDERVDEIWSVLDDGVRQRLRDLTFEQLFSSDGGKDLAKVLVKAIVNRNIATGSNVDTVAEALRRRCGSFCSADDVIIFKAQEQLKKASEVGGDTDLGRNLLNESLRLFQQVAEALTFENLQNAATQYAGLQFFAGAISLALRVAKESDRGLRALAWVKDGRDQSDNRYPSYVFRKQCYDLVHRLLTTVDEVTSQYEEIVDGRLTTAAKKRNEAYAVVNESDDELFQFDLYDWYLSQGWTDKLLSVDSPFVIQYLIKESKENVAKADLLWKFYVHNKDFFSAATIQLELAKSQFSIPLSRRIEYLSRAKANAQANGRGGIGRQARQVLLYEISELLDVANIQDEILHRLKTDERVQGERKDKAVAALDDQILPMDTVRIPLQTCISTNTSQLFNEYADPGQYYDIALVIFESANHRNDMDIKAIWQMLIEQTHSKIQNDPEPVLLPYEAIINLIRDMANRLKNSETTFSPTMLIPLLELYALQEQNGIGARNWVMDLCIHVGWPFEIIIAVLNDMFYADTPPFQARNKQILADHILYCVGQWYDECMRSNQRLFGSEENAQEICTMLDELVNSGLTAEETEVANVLRRKIERSFRW
jgi:nuclear pore complex protein Nup155